MKTITHEPVGSCAPSVAARRRILSLPREPLFIADWLNVVMIHLEVEPKALQAASPFQLDLWKERAFVTLVAFTMRRMRPCFGGRLARVLFTPLASHQFLNVRTYIRHGDETGIHFLAEWLDSRLAVALGPRVFSLPYQHGRIAYRNEWQGGEVNGRVVDARTGTALAYRVDQEIGAAKFQPCTAGSLDEWLMERYTAFNGSGGASVPASRGVREGLSTTARGDARPTRQRRPRFFRVWHEPWPQVPVDGHLEERSLLASRWPFLAGAELIGANYSPGVRDVWMGWPHGISRQEGRESG